MDFGSILKGASDTFKKFETDVANASKEIGLGDGASSNKTTSTAAVSWENAADDDWEDVADIRADSAPSALSIDASSSSEPSSTTTSVPATTAISSAGNDPGSVNASASSPRENGIVAPAAPTADLEQRLETALARAKTAELKLFAMTRERDGLRRAHDNRTGDAELIKAKDKQIAAVLAEGEQLSIKIAEREATARNLRDKLRDSEATIAATQAALDAAEAKLEAAGARTRQLENANRSAEDARDAAERRLRASESDARDKKSSSAALDAARAQLDALRKAQTTALEDQQMRLTAERETALAEAHEKAEAREVSLQNAIAELRARVSQVLQEAGARADDHQKDAKALRERAQHLEARNEELAAALPDATRPLLRQVHALQAAAEERERARTGNERAQLERLRAAQKEAAAANARVAAAEERVTEVLARAAALEEAARISRDGRERTEGASKILREEKEALERKRRDDAERHAEQCETMKKECDFLKEELRRERASALDAADAAESSERELKEKISGLESRVTALQERLSAAASAKILHSASADGFAALVDSAPSTPTIRETDMFSDASASGEGQLYATERLAATLRQRNGEVASLQAQLRVKEEATQALAEEVVSLTSRADTLAADLGDAPQVKAKLEDLENRHSTLLVLLGEREERMMELEADLADVKQMYKEQLNELLLRIEKMSS